MNAKEKMAILRRAIEGGAFERAKVLGGGFFWAPGTRVRSANAEDDARRVLEALERAEKIIDAPVKGDLAVRFIGALVYDKARAAKDSRGRKALVRLGRCREPLPYARRR